VTRAANWKTVIILDSLGIEIDKLFHFVAQPRSLIEVVQFSGFKPVKSRLQ
jgi:hypothetical protein